MSATLLGWRAYIFKTKKGELSLHCKEFKMLCKTLEPLPEKYHGLADVEIKYRHRHLDLITDQDSRDVFIKRSRIITEVRKLLSSPRFS